MQQQEKTQVLAEDRPPTPETTPITGQGLPDLAVWQTQLGMLNQNATNLGRSAGGWSRSTQREPPTLRIPATPHQEQRELS